jgi:hypothetical protein
MLRRACASKLFGKFLSRCFASAISVHPTPNEHAYKFVLPRRIAVNGCSVDLRSRELFQPQHLDDVVAKVRCLLLKFLARVINSYCFIQVAATLFAIPAVDALYFGPDFITVTRARTPGPASAAPWECLRDEIVQHLELFCEERQQQQLAKDAARLDSTAEFDDPTEALIVDIIETQVGTQNLALGLCRVTPTHGRFEPLCRKMAGTSRSSAGTSSLARCG